MIPLVSTVRLAAEVLLKLKKDRQVVVTKKADGSPVTNADIASEAIIIEQLNKFYPSIPIVGEEGHKPTFSIRQSWSSFFLVDALDGTNHYIKGDDDFAINIALIEGQVPTLGCIALPAQGTVYVADPTNGCFKIDENGFLKKLEWPTTNAQDSEWIFADSPSSPNKHLKTLMEMIPNSEVKFVGGAKKFTDLCDSTAHLYWRRESLFGWDVAAGHALLRAMIPNHCPAKFPTNYNTLDFRVDPFWIANPMIATQISAGISVIENRLLS